MTPAIGRLSENAAGDDDVVLISHQIHMYRHSDTVPTRIRFPVPLSNAASRVGLS